MILRNYICKTAPQNYFAHKERGQEKEGLRDKQTVQVKVSGTALEDATWEMGNVSATFPFRFAQRFHCRSAVSIARVRHHGIF